MRRRPQCVAVILGMGLLQSLIFVYDMRLAWAQAGPLASEPQRPALQIGSAGRFNEDWSVLRGVDLSTTDDVWDRLKFIPLTKDGSVYLTLGGQARERVEYFRHFLFGASEPEDTDGYLLSRYRLSADLHVTRYFRMFVEGKSAFALDRDLQGGRTTAFVDELDLLNGFADIMIPLGSQASVTLARWSPGADLRFPAAGRAGRLLASPKHLRWWCRHRSDRRLDHHPLLGQWRCRSSTSTRSTTPRWINSFSASSAPVLCSSHP